MVTTSRTTNASNVSAQLPPPSGKPMTSVVHANATALNFTIDPKILAPSIPASLTLDYYKGDCFVSLVCMEIRKLPLLGLPLIPKFCELSLRCFVSQRSDSNRRGVLYLKTYGSSKLGCWALHNLVPHEYQLLNIKSNSRGYGDNQAPEIDYQWKVEGNDNRVRIKGRDPITKRQPGTKVGFILDHLSRYQVSHGSTFYYDIDRPKWVLWDAAQANFTCDVRRLFGKQFVRPLAARPVSVFIAAGSKVTLRRPAKV